MENIRIYEEDGYIHFIMRPEDLMRLRYSTEAKTPFADFMDRWLTQMKTQVRENTMKATATHLKSTSSRFLPHEEQRLPRHGRWIFRILST